MRKVASFFGSSKKEEKPEVVNFNAPPPPPAPSVLIEEDEEKPLSVQERIRQFKLHSASANVASRPVVKMERTVSMNFDVALGCF